MKKSIFITVLLLSITVAACGGKQEDRKEFSSSNDIEKQIREVFKEYIKALKKQNVNKYKYLISNQSIKAGEGNIKPFQMKNQYRQVSNNPYIVKISKDRKEAVLTFKYSRKGTANPYILIYEDSRWKVDLTQMWKRIRFGPMNKWYWVDKWNK